jgi:tripartite-type tricarboxylate transporter receptor subunit TctC
MDFLRREFFAKFLHLTAGAAALMARSRVAGAQTYPSRPVRVLVGYGAGATPDIYARLVAGWLTGRLGQTFVTENRPGAATNLAAEAAVRAEPDGYTLLLVASPNFINATLYDNLNFNFIRDIAPVASVGRAPFVMVVPPSFPARSVAEFIAYAKANPGKINMASGGTGTLTHFSGELFKMLAGVDMVHVPYRTEALGLTDMIAGRADVMFVPVTTSIEHIRTGKLRALAVTTAMRLDLLPDAPPIGDFVPGYEVTGWAGIGAPRNTPAAIVDALNAAINAGLADAALKGRLLAIGSLPIALSSADYGKVFVTETEKWARVIKFAGIKPE